MNALAKVRRAWRVSGWRGVLFGTLGAFGIRLAGWYVTRIDPLERPPAGTAAVATRLLAADDWPKLQALRPTLTHTEFSARLERGDLCAAVEEQGRLLAASWLTFTRAPQPFLDLDLRLAPACVYTFDAWVDPQARGRRLHGRLSTELRRLAHARGARWAHSLIGFENRPSLTAMRRLGYRRVGTVMSIGPRRWRLRLCVGPGGWQAGRRVVLRGPEGTARSA